MTEKWLNPNRRFLLCELVLAALVALAGILLGWRGSDGSWRSAGHVLLIVAGSVAALWTMMQIARPRIAYRDRQLLVNLRMGRALAVPIQHVECFFLGQSSIPLPGGLTLNRRVSTVVVRLSDSASEWAHRDVWPVLGKWSDGYITIYGTGCESLDVQRVNQLNRRLREVQRSL